MLKKLMNMLFEDEEDDEEEEEYEKELVTEIEKPKPVNKDIIVVQKKQEQVKENQQSAQINNKPVKRAPVEEAKPKRLVPNDEDNINRPRRNVEQPRRSRIDIDIEPKAPAAPKYHSMQQMFDNNEPYVIKPPISPMFGLCNSNGQYDTSKVTMTNKKSTADNKIISPMYGKSALSNEKNEVNEESIEVKSESVSNYDEEFDNDITIDQVLLNNDSSVFVNEDTDDLTKQMNLFEEEE